MIHEAVECRTLLLRICELSGCAISHDTAVEITEAACIWSLDQIMIRVHLYGNLRICCQSIHLPALAGRVEVKLQDILFVGIAEIQRNYVHSLFIVHRHTKHLARIKYIHYLFTICYHPVTSPHLPHTIPPSFIIQSCAILFFSSAILILIHS